MYVVIGETEYASISELQFEPETDVIGSTVPVNELWVSIRTNDAITVGSRISLYDDLDNLWAKYWVTYAEKLDKYTMRVHGESTIMRLDKMKVSAHMYTGEALREEIRAMIMPFWPEIDIDDAFVGVSVRGFCPEQTRRERLQWLCMVGGAYIRNFFSDKLEVRAIDDEEVLIPLEKTFWKPKVTYTDYVTAVEATYYSYVERTPSRTEKYVEVGDKVYVETESKISIRNPAFPSEGVLENVVTIENVKIINSTNVDDILSRLATYYFKRTKVNLDAINNGEFIPGQLATFYTDENTLMSGYIDSCSFSFGNQARASISISAAEDKDGASVMLICMWGQMQVSKREFTLPVGYEYELEVPYVDITFNAHRYVFRPRVKQVSGTVQQGGNEHVVQVDIALDYYQGDLYVRDVDQVSMSDGVVVIT